MINKILWTIDNELDGNLFERICTDLLFREGYNNIIPLGGNYDNGRDAEIRKLKGKNEIDEITFFQYSLEKKWKQKLEREIIKAFQKHSSIDSYVFVTSSKVTGKNRDLLKAKYHKKYNTNLVIYDREWLRNRLEVSNYDITKKYLGIDDQDLVVNEEIIIDLHLNSDQNKKKHWRQYFRGNYEAAIISFKEELLIDPNNPNIIMALAWSLYLTRNYDEALFYINNGIDIIGYDYNTKAIKACILAESGIKKRSQEHLLIAKKLFVELAKNSKRAIDHFNLGNTLSALGEFEASKKSFLRSLEYNKDRAETWKNLGNVYSYLNDYEEEMECYDKALSINPILMQAIVSKAATLIKHFNSPKKALKLFNKALSLDEKIPMLWEHYWFWYAEAQYRLKNYEEALKSVESGLKLIPDHYSMPNLKANILSKLWRKNKDYYKTSIEYFLYRLEAFENEIESILELLDIYSTFGEHNEYWKLVSKKLNYKKINLKSYCKNLNIDNYIISIVKFKDLYEEHRSVTPLQRYYDLDDFNFIENDERFYEVLHLEFLIPFSKFSKELIWFHNKSTSIRSLEKILYSLFNEMKIVLPRISIQALSICKKKTKEQKINAFSHNVAHWALIASLEMSSQIGFLMGRLNLDEQYINAIHTILDKKMNGWTNKMILLNLEVINKKMKLFKY